MPLGSDWLPSQSSFGPVRPVYQYGLKGGVRVVVPLDDTNSYQRSICGGGIGYDGRVACPQRGYSAFSTVDEFSEEHNSFE